VILLDVTVIAPDNKLRVAPAGLDDALFRVPLIDTMQVDSNRPPKSAICMTGLRTGREKVNDTFPREHVVLLFADGTQPVAYPVQLNPVRDLIVEGVNVELVIDQSWPLSSEPPPSFVRLPVTANVVLNPE